MLFALVMFAIGAAICGAAQSMGMLIAGRSGLSRRVLKLVSVLIYSTSQAVMGLGSGGILSMSEIIIADLVVRFKASKVCQSGLLTSSYTCAATPRAR